MDDDTWTRGRGWGLTGALLAYTAYAHESPGNEAATTRQIRAVLEDWGSNRSCG
ncbi:hypothetical protein [Streptomyces sp. BH105]|uniref:hypothetical protein n=1 Tax=Streptomyces sp. BH105 TaxID=3410408 RepID=UPI003CE7F158